MSLRPAHGDAGLKEPSLKARAANQPVEPSEALEDGAPGVPKHSVRRLPDSVDFASRRAARGKMQLWLTTFTVVAALAVLVVVSVSVFHAS
jgi:hypothetical protein